MNGGEEARVGASMLSEWCVDRSVCPRVPGQFARPSFSLFTLRHEADSFLHSWPIRSRIVPFERITPHSQHHGNECQHKQ